MKETNLRERERHRALALADAMMNLRQKLDELEVHQRCMVHHGVEPAHVMTLEARQSLETWMVYHERRALYRLRFGVPVSPWTEKVREANRRAKVVWDVL